MTELRSNTNTEHRLPLILLWGGRKVTEEERSVMMEETEEERSDGVTCCDVAALLHGLCLTLSACAGPANTLMSSPGKLGGHTTTNTTIVHSTYHHQSTVPYSTVHTGILGGGGRGQLGAHNRIVQKIEKTPT